MSTLREAAKEALRWMEHARLHLTIKERMHPDGLHLYDSAAEALRSALAQPKTELRDQHKAFTHWYFGLRGINEANFSPEDLAWAAWKAALAQPEAEAPIAAKCQRIERSGEICGLTPPCPDCGSSLIDVPEGSL